MELLQGNEATVRGALAAGVRFFGGYPITPSSEIAEEMSRLLPKVGGVFLQMEDEIASLGACIGARLAGLKAMTATSGPGYSLMQEHIGFAIMTEVPVVIVNVMRGGPSTGLPTKLSQADIMQARWGTHGSPGAVALAPWSVRESFDLTVRAVNLSEYLRMPVTVLSDEVIAHMREGVELPEEVEVYDAGELKVPPEKYLHYDDGTEFGVPRADYGKGYRFHVTGLAHGKDGFPTNDPEVITWMMNRFTRKIEANREMLTDYEYRGDDDPEILFVAIGSAARVVMEVIRRLEGERRAGLLRPRIVWPFPYEAVRSRAEGAEHVVVVEQNQGQLVHLVREAVGREVFNITKFNGELVSPQEIMEGLARFKLLKKASP